MNWDIHILEMPFYQGDVVEMANMEMPFKVGDARVPIYQLADVARYAGVHPSTTRYWVRWIPGRVIEAVPSPGLSFLDLVSILIMRELRNFGVKPSRIRRAEDYLTRRLGPYPLARHVIWTDGGHVLFDPESPLREELPESVLVSADLEGQQAFVQLIRTYLHSISYSEEGIAIAWYPNDRVKLDPSVQFGQPCVRDTRVVTRAIYLMHRAGDTTETIMTSFAVLVEDIHAALEWETGLEQAVA